MWQSWSDDKNVPIHKELQWIDSSGGKCIETEEDFPELRFEEQQYLQKSH